MTAAEIFYKRCNRIWNKMLLKANELVGDRLADDDIIFVLMRFVNASLNGTRCCSESFSWKSLALTRKIR